MLKLYVWCENLGAAAAVSIRRAVRSGELGGEVCVHAVEVERIAGSVGCLVVSVEYGGRVIGAVETAENCNESFGLGGAEGGKTVSLGEIGIICVVVLNI